MNLKAVHEQIVNPKKMYYYEILLVKVTARFSKVKEALLKSYIDSYFCFFKPSLIFLNWCSCITN